MSQRQKIKMLDSLRLVIAVVACVVHTAGAATSDVSLFFLLCLFTQKILIPFNAREKAQAYLFCWKMGKWLAPVLHAPAIFLNI